MIDLIASEPQYMAHLSPLWDALPERGRRVNDRNRTADAVLVASGRDLNRASRLGYGRIACLEHGIGQSYGNREGYPGGKKREAVGLFLSPNETAARADRRAYPAARVTVVGDPRLDTLPRREPGPPCIAISFHWDAADAKPWSLSAKQHYRRVLAPLAAAFPLIGHAHPRAAHTLAPLYRRLGIEFVSDFDEVCRRADVYIADNTSTLYEFASTGRPVVVLNAPWFDRSVELGLRFWEAANVGIQADEPSDLIPAVERALADGPEQRSNRERALDVAYGYRSGAAERGAAAVSAWLTDRQAVAA